MKKSLFILALTLKAGFVFTQTNVGIGTVTPHSSALLDLVSTDKGILVPRMTTLQRNAISSPAAGLMVYDTDSKYFYFYNGNGWVALNSSTPVPTQGLTLPIDTFGNFISRVISVATSNTVMTQPMIQGTGINGAGVVGISTNSTGVQGNSQNSYAVYGLASSSTKASVMGTNNGGGPGVHGAAVFSSTNAVGVKGETTAGKGVLGIATTGFGIFGEVTSGVGVRGASETGTGVYGGASNNGTGVEGWNGGSGIGMKAVGNNGFALDAFVSGSGTAGRFTQGNSLGKALEVAGNLLIHGGNTNPGIGKVLTSDANGNATWQSTPAPHKIAFKIHDVITTGANNFNASTWYKVYFANEEYDYGNNISVGATVANSVFTAPIAGLYHFEASVEWAANGIHSSMGLYKVGTNGAETQIILQSFGESLEDNPAYVGWNVTNQISTDVRLNPGEKVYVKAFWTNGYISGSSFTTVGLYPSGLPRGNSFTGHLVFAD